MKEQMNDFKNGRLLTRKEAAEFLNVKEITLAIWHSTQRYKIPMSKMGRLARYRQNDLERFVEQQTVNKPDVPNDNK